MYFDPDFKGSAEKGISMYFFFKGNQILTLKDKVQFTLPEIELYHLKQNILRVQYLNRVGERFFYVAELSSATVATEGMSFYDLRRLFGRISEDSFFLAGEAFQIVYWNRTHQYCSRCGAKMENKKDERAKYCPSCGFVNYPRISPAIIVAVTRENKILLAKGRDFKGSFYSILAGFVEPGETFEECVQREIQEEVNLRVKNIKYFSSQPWPFPDSLMVGFTAEYAGGEIMIDKKEILEAEWFAAEQLPKIPRFGIARRLIDRFVQKQVMNS